MLNPATNEVVGKLPHATREDLDRALAGCAARRPRPGPAEVYRAVQRAMQAARVTCPSLATVRVRWKHLVGGPPA